MTLANAILLIAALVCLVFVLAFAGVIFVWLMRRRPHDPHAAPFGDAPFVPSAVVALRRDAGGCGLQRPLGAAAARTSGEAP